MDLSRYVVETVDAGGCAVLFNTVSKVVLPVGSSVDVLRENFFLVGQELDAINVAMGSWSGGDMLFLQVAPTWRCNLRCTHCIVLDRLRDVDESKLDLVGLKDFVCRFVSAFGICRINLAFYGAEPLLDADVCLEVLNICKSVLPVDASLVTNLAMDLSPVHLELLSGMNRIAISLDGLEEGHNAQRLPFVGGGNMWRATLENLRVLVKAGLKDRISVKGCVRDKLGVEEEREFVRLLLRYGISGRSIGLGTMAPTEGVPLPSEIFLEGLGNPKLGNAACCRYRSQVVLVDSTNGVFSDFYEHSRLGSIYDSVDFLREQHDKLVLDSFPALNDPKCMKCSVVGYCWGGCSILGKVRKYSSYCNQAALVERVRDRAKAGSLIGR